MFLGLFFLSGAASLGCQIVWSRMFAAGLGQEVPAVLAVLGAIFGGMAIGSWGGDAAAFERFGVIRGFASLQLAIGAWAFATIWIVPWCNDWALRLTGLQPSGLWQGMVAFGLPFIVLLPATAAMGATFPVLERLLSPAFNRGRFIGALYAANTFGAASGVLACTWWWLPRLGLSASLGVISGVSLVCAMTALLHARQYGERLGLSVESPNRETRAPIQTTTSARSGDHRTSTGSSTLLRARMPALRNGKAKEQRENQPVEISRVQLGTLLGATGLLGIGFEIVGIRILAQMMENTVYSYAAVLVIFLFGTASGAAIYQRACSRVNLGKSLHLFSLALAFSCCAGSVALACAPALYSALRARLFTTLTGVVLVELLTSGCVFLLPTLAMGATLSHLLRLAKDQQFGIGWALGINTLGSALAPFLMGTIIYPVVGAKWSLAILVTGYVVLAPGPLLTLGLAPVLLMVLSLLPSFRFVDIPPQGKLLSFRAGSMDSVAVVEHADGNRTLLVNNRFAMGGTGAIAAERRHADIPLLLHPHPKRALFLGLGTAITFAASVAHPDLRADGVELVPEVVQAFPWFAPHNSLPNEPNRFRVFTADARRFVRVTPDRYDVVVADLFHPARDGAASLYAVEHFEAIRRHLEPGGLFCQWLPLFQLDALSLRSIVRTFLAIFPNAHAFMLRFNIDTPVLGLIGTSDEIHYRPGYFVERVPANSSLAEQLKTEQLRDGLHLFGCFLAGPDALRRFAQKAPVNSDDRPAVLFSAPRFTGKEVHDAWGLLFALLANDSSGAEELIAVKSPSDSDFVHELNDFIAARNVYLQGLVAESEGELEKAIDLYVESARRCAEFTTGYAQCLTLATQRHESDPTAARRLLQRLIDAQPNRPVAAQLMERLDSVRNR